MNIQSNYTKFNPNFNARIKMRPAKIEAIQKAVAATATTVSGAASVVAGVDSFNLTVPASDDNSILLLDSMPEEKLDSTRHWLKSQEVEGGYPTQSSATPSALISSGASVASKGFTSYNGKNIEQATESVLSEPMMQRAYTFMTVGLIGSNFGLEELTKEYIEGEFMTTAGSFATTGVAGAGMSSTGASLWTMNEPMPKDDEIGEFYRLS